MSAQDYCYSKNRIKSTKEYNSFFYLCSNFYINDVQIDLYLDIEKRKSEDAEYKKRKQHEQT